jgi:hypothetical protein
MSIWAMRDKRTFQTFAPPDFSSRDTDHIAVPRVPEASKLTHWAGEDYRADAVAFGLFVLHLAIIAFVLLGWGMHSRDGLLAYLLLLPAIGLQWLFNGGSSIVNNSESWLRSGHWRDAANAWEGSFFRTLLYKTLGLEVRDVQINAVVGFAMAMLWMTALFHLVMIPA